MIYVICRTYLEFDRWCRYTEHINPRGRDVVCLNTSDPRSRERLLGHYITKDDRVVHCGTYWKGQYYSEVAATLRSRRWPGDGIDGSDC